MSIPPLVSIIIPTYNRAHLIGETLDSILAQTYTHWECIIVDDGSTDDTDQVVGEYLKKDSRFKYFHRPDTHLPGGNGARNYGFLQSKGEYINWFDSDDLMDKEFLHTGVENIKDTKVDFVLFDYKVFNNNTGDFFVDQVNKTNNLLEDYISFKINFGTCAILWKRKLVKNFSFNEELVKAQDLDFNFRVFTNTEFSFVNSNKYGMYARGHENSIVQAFKKNNLKSIISELTVRRSVFIYTLKHNFNEDIKVKCFDLYLLPLLKLLRLNEIWLIYKELNCLIKIDFKYFIFNILWYLKAIFWLLIIFLFNKGEYRFKSVLLKYKY